MSEYYTANLALFRKLMISVKKLETAANNASKNPHIPNIIFHIEILSLRLKNLKEITKRLDHGFVLRSKFLDGLRYNNEKRGKQDRSWAPFKKAEQNIYLDLESMYIYTNLVVDQLSMIIYYSLQLTFLEKKKKKKKHIYPFSDLYGYISTEIENNNKLDPFLLKYEKDFTWIQYNIRYFRNEIIEHIMTPSVRSYSSTVYGRNYRMIITPQVSENTNITSTDITSESIDNFIEKYKHLILDNNNPMLTTLGINEQTYKLCILLEFVDELEREDRKILREHIKDVGIIVTSEYSILSERILLNLTNFVTDISTYIN